ncbi:MAG TPA: NAD(P)H-dependent oxidoreductase [Pseudomonadales bacterium]|nr:NAD(P)H-dependent oxidoreductase [Pseudomonadales bacterium]
MRWLAISGSLRRQSSNTELLRAATAVAPAGVTIDLYDGLDRLPHFNPDVEPATVDAVMELKRRLAAADGLILSTPEYARGVPGSLKNALDWLVSGSEFVGKPVAILSASNRSQHAYASLRTTVATMSGDIVDAASITLPLLGRNLDAAGIAADAELARQLGDALTAFADAIARQTREGA